MNTKGFLAKILSLSASRVIQDVLQAVLLLWLARTDQSGYGLFVFSAGVAGMVRAALSLGLDEFALREFSGDEGARRPLLGRMIEIKTGLGAFILFSLVVFALLKGWEGVQTIVVVVIVAGRVMESISDAFFNLFRAEGRQVREGFYRTASNLSGAVYGAICLYLGFGIVAFAFFVIISSGLKLAFSLVGVLKMGFAPERYKIGSFLPPGQVSSVLTIVGVVLMGSFYNYIQVFFIKHYHELTKVAFYGAASDFAGSFSGIVAQLVVGAVLFPELAAAARMRKNEFSGLVRGYFWNLVSHGTGVAFFLSTFGGLILVLFFGQDYKESILPLRILGPAVLLSFVNNFCIYVFFAMGRERQLLFLHLIPVLLSIVAGLYLIPAFGPTGAAVNLLICRAAMSISVFILAQRSLSLIRWPELRRFLIPAVPGGIVFLLLCQVELYSASLATLLVYGLIMRITGVRRFKPGSKVRRNL